MSLNLTKEMTKNENEMQTLQARMELSWEVKVVVIMPKMQDNLEGG